MFDDFFEMMRPAPATAFRKYDARSKLNSEAQQKAYILSRLNRFLALFWGRRTGKTTFEQHDMIEEATTHPACSVAFVGPTIDQAIKLVWAELVEWSKEVGGVANHGRHEIRFPNRSIIYLLGSETKKQIDRIRGLKNLRLLVWDEQQSANSDLAIYALTSVIMPMLADRRGRLVLSGTGGPEHGHWFNIVTHGSPGGKTENPEFVVFRGPTMRDNPLIGDRADEELAIVCNMLGVKPGDPYILREYGIWGQGIQFTTDSERTPFRKIPLIVVPELDWPGWSFVIGGDVGSVDLSAASVTGLHPHYKGAVMVESVQEKTPAATDQIAFFRRMAAKYQPRSARPVMISLDPGGGGAGVIVDLGRIGGFWEVCAADKFDKGINVRLMASDVTSEWLKLTPGNEVTKAGLEKLEWEPGKEGHRLLGHAPDPADSGLYSWRTAKKLFDSVYVGPKPADPAVSVDMQRFLEQQDAEAQLLEDLGFN